MSAAANYSSTDVPVSRSQDELRGLLRRFGADSFTMGEGTDWVGVEFVHGGMLVRLRCPLRPYDDRLASRPHKKRLTPETWQEAEAQRVWRVLVWSVKARLVAVEEGLETFEQAFLSHLVDPATRRTIWQRMQELVESGAFAIASGSGLPELGR
jgi:hypothetical protein